MKQKVAEWLNTVFGFRKFIIMLLLLVVGIIFRIEDMISGAEFVDLLKGSVVAFFAANGAEHLISIAKDVMNKGQAPSGPADTDESNDEKEIDLK